MFHAQPPTARRFGASFSLRTAVVVALTSALVALPHCAPKRDAADENVCRGAAALTAKEIRGSSLPRKTLALTFDDGPGARTTELSSYLKQEGIRAAFFVNGRNVNGPTALAQIVADGHVVANHTQTHRSLTGRSTGGAALAAPEAVTEIAETDALIAAFVPNNRFIFRPPFGDYDDTTFAAVEGSPMKKYVGPVGWDIGDRMGEDRAADWDCWVEGADGVVLTVAQCGDLYVKEIEGAGNGIVLLHDPYFVDDDPTKGGTVDLVKYIVPILKKRSFAFARLDEVPEIAALLPALPAADAGRDGSAQGFAPGSGSNPGSNSNSPGGASGGDPEPCPPSPQGNTTNYGESGILIRR